MTKNEDNRREVFYILSDAIDQGELSNSDLNKAYSLMLDNIGAEKSDARNAAQILKAMQNLISCYAKLCNTIKTNDEIDWHFYTSEDPSVMQRRLEYARHYVDNALEAYMNQIDLLLQ